MEFYEVVEKRRSIRQFEDKPISAEMIERILHAGLKAPSSNHQRQWVLVTLTDKAMIRDLAKIVKPYSCRITEPKTPQQEIEESACVILPYFKMKYDLKSAANDYGLMDYGAAWALIENILLAATAEGLGSVVHIPVKKEPAQIKEFLNAPEGYYLPALVMLGYTKENAEVPTQVKATVENNVRWNGWRK